MESMRQTTSGVRTYRGRTLGEILPQIHSELGPDAVILREREGFLGGIGGFFAQRFIEVDARRGDGRPIDIPDEAPRAEVPPPLQRERPGPAGRRFETAAFMDRLREASAVLRDDDLLDLPATWTPAAGPAPTEPESRPRDQTVRKPAAEPKPKRKSKNKAKDEAKAKRKGKGKTKAKAEKQVKARPAPQPSLRWAVEPEATRRVESRIANEPYLKPPVGSLLDLVVAVLLFMLLGRRRYGSSDRAGEQAPCPLCRGRSGSGARCGCGRSLQGRSQWLRRCFRCSSR
jgi:flagellar biosynthesis GTPase FlhF